MKQNRVGAPNKYTNKDLEEVNQHLKNGCNITQAAAKTRFKTRLSLSQYARRIGARLIYVVSNKSNDT